MVDTRSYPGLVARIPRPFGSCTRVARQTRIYCAPSGIRVRERLPRIQVLVQPAFGPYKESLRSLSLTSSHLRSPVVAPRYAHAFMRTDCGWLSTRTHGSIAVLTRPTSRCPRPGKNARCRSSRSHTRTPAAACGCSKFFASAGSAPKWQPKPCASCMSAPSAQHLLQDHRLPA